MDLLSSQQTDKVLLVSWSFVFTFHNDTRIMSLENHLASVTQVTNSLSILLYRCIVNVAIFSGSVCIRMPMVSHASIKPKFIE